MFQFLKKRAYPIGVDMGDDSLRLAQLTNGGKGMSIVASSRADRPADVKPGSADWQRWALEAIRLATANGRFHGKEVVAAIPAREVHVELVRMPKAADGKVEDAIFSKIRQNLPFEPVRKNTMMQCIPTDQDNVLVTVTERKIIERHLAIFQRAHLNITSIGVWPMALANCYAKFFCRRRTDTETVVMLLNIETNSSNLVICRHENPLFASCIPIGSQQLADENMVTRLVLELTASRRRFASTRRHTQIERLIFLSGPAADVETYTTIAKQLEIQAQIGDCVAALEMADPDCCGIDRRNGNVSWATAFGLSLS